MRRVAFAFVALLVSGAAGATLPPCPRHVQSVLLSRQYDACAAYVKSSSFPFSARHAHALSTHDGCHAALTELLTVAPRAPCAVHLSDNEDIVIDLQELQWVASHPANSLRLASRSGGSAWYHFRYSCYFDTTQPMNASDPTQEFGVFCRESFLVEYPGAMGWIGYVLYGFFGIVAVVMVVGLIVMGLARLYGDFVGNNRGDRLTDATDAPRSYGTTSSARTEPPSSL